MIKYIYLTQTVPFSPSYKFFSEVFDIYFWEQSYRRKNNEMDFTLKKISSIWLVKNTVSPQIPDADTSYLVWYLFSSSVIQHDTSVLEICNDIMLTTCRQKDNCWVEKGKKSTFLLGRKIFGLNIYPPIFIVINNR